MSSPDETCRLSTTLRRQDSCRAADHRIESQLGLWSLRGHIRQARWAQSSSRICSQVFGAFGHSRRLTSQHLQRHVIFAEASAVLQLQEFIQGMQQVWSCLIPKWVTDANRVPTMASCLQARAAFLTHFAGECQKLACQKNTLHMLELS